MPQPLLVFDLDGTLVDSAPDLLAALDAVLRAYGFPLIDHSEAVDGIGHGARHLIDFAVRQSQAEIAPGKLDAMLADFLVHYQAHIADFTRPYPGLLLLLDRFGAAGWRFAVCTNKPEAMSRQLLATLGIAGRFAAVCGGDTFATRKPDPAHLLGTIAAAGGEPETSIMVGDSRTDLDAARSAAVPIVGVTFGYTPVPMVMLQPDLLVERYDDLRVEVAARLIGSAGRQGAPSAA